MQTHELKIWPKYFLAILAGIKTFELRKNDRGFKSGDMLRLREWKPSTREYTGTVLLVDVLYVIHGYDDLIKGSLGADYVIMSIKPRRMDDDVSLSVSFKRIMLCFEPQWLFRRRMRRLIDQRLKLRT